MKDYLITYITIMIVIVYITLFTNTVKIIDKLDSISDKIVCSNEKNK